MPLHSWRRSEPPLKPASVNAGWQKVWLDQKKCSRLGHLEEAEALLSELEVSYPDVLSIKQLMAEVSGAVEEKKRRRQLLENLTAIRKLLSKKKWADAVASLGELMKQFPDEDDVRSLSVYAQRRLELQRKTKHVKTIRREAISANEAHDFERALQLINEGLRLYPGEPALKMILARTDELRNEYQRQSGIQAGRQRAIELTAKNDFSAAVAVIDSTADTWNTDELTELRRQIQTKQEEVQRVQAIAKACASIKDYLGSESYEDALTAGQQALAQFPEEPSHHGTGEHGPGMSSRANTTGSD
jgi:tetratricopeptide (TPR) repeat protein